MNDKASLGANVKSVDDDNQWRSKTMTDGLIGYQPDYAVPPGETLLEALDGAGLTRAELAQRAELSVKHVNRIVKGHVALTPSVAVKFERVLGIPAQLWNAREAAYRARLEQLAEREATAEDRAWLEVLPRHASGARIPRRRD